MADDYLFYEEDYEDISDWDDESDGNNDENNTHHVEQYKEDQEEEKKISLSPSSPTSTSIKNGASIKSTPKNKTQFTTSTSNDYICPYVPSKTTSSSFIVHKYSVFTTKVFILIFIHFINKIK